MWRSKRSRVVAGIALGVAVAAGVVAAYWWGVAARLSPAEQRLVGTWQHRGDPIPEAPRGTLAVWHLRPDRSCRVELLDAGSGQPLDAMGGRWRAAGGELVCDWERKRDETGVDPYLIESAGDGEVILRPRGGPVRYDLQRAAGQ
jgi:hypothetical protein